MADDTTPAAWRTTRPASPTGPRRRRIALALAALVALTGVTLGVALWLSPPRAPAWVPVWITAEPPAGGVGGAVPWSEQDRRALVESGLFGRPADDAATPNPNRDRVRLRLAALGRRPAREPVVVTLSAPAGVDANGRVYLLAADPVGDHPRNPVGLVEALEAVRVCPAKHVLLVLDLWPVDRPALTATAPETLSAAVARTLDETPDARRLCLVSSDAGQVPLASAGLGRSAFGHYLERGLRGDADGWNASADRDGRVSAAELAGYVRARVERWSATNGVAAQTPRLIGSGDDFTLRPYSNDELVNLNTLTETPPPPTVPDWLAAAWADRDKLLADPVGDNRGRARRRAESLLAAERAWAAGRPSSDVQRELEKAIKDADRTPTPAGKANPDPAPSLAALAVVAPLPADPALAAELKAAVVKAEARPPEVPPAGKPAPPMALWPELDPLKSKPHAPLAAAAFALLADDPTPPTVRVRQLDRLLAAQEATPRFAETLLVRRLAELPGDNPARTGRVLRIGCDFEAAAVVPELHAWATPALDEAYRRWADAQAALFSPGYVSVAEADRRLAAAADAGRRVKRFADAVRDAAAVRDDSLDHLGAAYPAFAAGLVPLPSAEAFADTTRGLVDALAPPAEPLGLDALPARTEEWRRRTDTGTAALAAFDRPFRSTAALRERVAGSDSTPATLAEADALLHTPLVPTADRLSLWNAVLAASKRLSDDVVRRDATDDAAVASGASPAYRDPRQPGPPAPRPADAADRPARWSAALLRASGVADDKLPEFDEPVRLDRLRDLWLEVVPSRADRWPSPAVGAWVAAARETPAADAPVPNPLRKVWAWQARRFDYERNDPLDPAGGAAGVAFAAAAARACVAASDGPPPAPVLDVTPPADAGIPADASAVTIPVGLRVVDAPAVSVVELRTLSPSPAWLTATAEGSVTLDAGRERKVPVRVAVGDATADPDARGVLLEGTVGGRTFHRRLPVGLDAVVNRLGLFVQTDPKGPPRPAADVRLRPHGVAEPYLFSLSNPGPRPRTVVVRLSALGSETAPVTVPAGGLAPLVFPAPPATTPPTPAPDFRPLVDGLTFEVLEGDTRRVAQRFPVAVGVADPARYLTVTDVAFRPAAGGRPNSLGVRVVPDAPLGPPPCPVEIGFPADLNAGLLPVRDGKLKAPLPADGSPLRLYAERLAAVGPGGGSVTVAVSADGSERAFLYRGSVASGGEVTQFARVTDPLVRAKAAEYASGTAPLPVKVEVDNPPDGGRVEVRLGSYKDDRFVTDAFQSLTAPKERVVLAQRSPDGAAVLLRGVFRDWQIELPVEFLVGVRDLEARVFDAAGVEVARTKPGTTVTFDNATPTGIQFLALPPRARKDVALAVRATSDLPVSGVKEVKFFLGRPEKNAPPAAATVVAGKLVEAKGNVWEAAVPVPVAGGPVSVTAQFVSKAGPSGFESQDVELVDAAELAKPQPGKITGKVVEGPRPQAGIVVVLLDDKGEKARATTKADGSYEFADVAPGKYRLYAEKEASGRKADQTADVKAGEETKVTLELFL